LGGIASPSNPQIELMEMENIYSYIGTSLRVCDDGAQLRKTCDSRVSPEIKDGAQ